MGDAPAWRAEGLLFENCNCALLCRAHLSYKNLCDSERCLFQWGIRFEDGAYGEVPLGGLSVFIAGFVIGFALVCPPGPSSAAPWRPSLPARRAAPGRFSPGS